MADLDKETEEYKSSKTLSVLNKVPVSEVELDGQSETRDNIKDMNSNQGTSTDEDKTIEKAENVPVNISSIDILRIKNKFLENIEELRILRASDGENTQKITEMVTEKHEMERKMEDAFSANTNQAEEHIRDLAEVRKQMEQKMQKLESDKNQTMMKTDIWEKEVKTLKEQLKLLLVDKYSMEKTTKEQEHRIQMQSSAADSHISQMRALEERCKDLMNDFSNFGEQLTGLSAEVKCATELNNKLSRVNTHQKCIIESVTQENRDKRDKIVKIKAEHADKSPSDGDTKLKEKNATIQRLEELIANKVKANQQLENKLKEMKEAQQRTLKALSESHLLTDRHLDSSLKSAGDVSLLKDELNKTKLSLQNTEKQLTTSQEELEVERRQREVMESEFKSQILQTETSLKKLQDERADVSRANRNLDELNSSWAKKNIELNAIIQNLKEDAKENDDRIQKYQLQISQANRRPKSTDVATSTDVTIEENSKSGTIDMGKSGTENVSELVGENTLDARKEDKKDESAGTVSDAKCEGVGCSSPMNDERNAEEQNSSKNSSSDIMKEKGVEKPAVNEPNQMQIQNPTLEFSDVDNTNCSGFAEDKPVKQSGQLKKINESQMDASASLQSRREPRLPERAEPGAGQTVLEGPQMQITSARRTTAGTLEAAKKHSVVIQMQTINQGQDVQTMTTEEPGDGKTPVLTQPIVPPVTPSIPNQLGDLEEEAGKSTLEVLANPITNQRDQEERMSSDIKQMVDSAESIPVAPGTLSQTGTSTLITSHSDAVRNSPSIDNKNASINTSIGFSSNTNAEPKSTATSPESSFINRFHGLSHLLNTPRQDMPLKEQSRFSFTLPSVGPSSAGYISQPISASTTDRSAWNVTKSPMTSSVTSDFLYSNPTASMSCDNLSESQRTPVFQSSKWFPSPRIPTFMTYPVPSAVSTNKGSSRLHSGMMFTPRETTSNETPLMSSFHLFPNTEVRTPIHSKTINQQDFGKPSGSNKTNSQEDWPDFAEEFSMESNPEQSLTAEDRPPRKRRAEEECLFSDDEDDPKAGVASQIDRIQTFLKTDRLKRPKKHNKEPVV
ncbi:uncharacterized protein [Amphiura filiformis]|uniref:uncharacterized protein n=1 Tax=Amphiura filiformis TaxID=82378 RepID=UPI003B212112